MTRRRVAIIGAGFSGAVVAAQLLLRHGRDAVDVTLIERGRRFGPGLAYGVRDKNYLLNVRAANMSALASRPEDFARWLKARERGEPANKFAPRRRYGEYIEAVLRRAQLGAGFGRLKRVRDEAVSCRRAGSGWQIELVHRKAIDADAVVLALGNPAASPPPALADTPVINAWDAEARRHIPRRADVLLVGTGLTMVDVSLALIGGGHQGAIYALSRRGLVPRTQVGPSTSPPIGANQVPAALSDALHFIRSEVRAMAERGEPWQWALERLRAATPELWQRLAPEQKQRFLRHLRPWWDVHRHRAAPEVGARITELIESGKLRVLAGEIVSSAVTDRGVQIQHRQRGSFVRHRLEIGAVINCTGSVFDAARSTDPLVAQLHRDRLIRSHPTGLGFDVDANGRLLTAEGESNATLFTLGLPTQGAFWEATAAPEIRKRAEALAQILTSAS